MTVKNLFSFSLIMLLLFSCTRIQDFQTGEEAYEKAQYDLAIEMLQRQINKSEDASQKAELYLTLVNSYEKLSRYEEALNIAKLCSDLDEEGLCQEKYAMLLLKTGNYPEAEKYFKEAGLLQGDPFKFRKKLVDVKVLKRWSARNPQFELKALEKINTSFNEYGIHAIDDELVYTTDQKLDISEDIYDQTGNYDHNIVRSENKQPQLLDGVINTDAHEGSSTYSPETKTIIFTRCSSDLSADSTKCQLYESRYQNGNWGAPSKLNFCDLQAHYIHPNLYNQGKSLLFSSDMDLGWGGFDIYQSDRQEDGSWSEPVPLKQSINTPGDEKFPFRIEDTIYFSSDFHTGFGGLDIFKSYKLDNNRWTQATNLQQPINSGYDDFGLNLISAEEDRTMYICSARNGNDDIFKVKKVINVEQPEEEPLPLPQISLLVKVQERLSSGELLSFQDAVIIVKDQNSFELPVLNTGSKSVKEYELSEKNDYSILIQSAGYFNQRITVSTQDINLIPGAADIFIERTIILEPIELEKEIVLEDIYYDFDSWEIREDARPSLVKLSELMFDNPALKIELSSHTDCRGEDLYNEDLSQKRAESAREVLIAEGVDANRIVAIGYGERKLRIDCKCNRCTEEEHQSNRRTSFAVIENN